MNWGKSIVLVFIGFALFIGVLVTVCMKQEMSLVSADYYQQELDYQNQIDRIENTSALKVLPAISVVNDSLRLVYGDLNVVTSGVLKLTRASSARHDASFAIIGDKAASQIAFPLSNLPRGRYKASFEWVMNGEEYYIDKPIDL
jgi:hypothetical protein